MLLPALSQYNGVPSPTSQVVLKDKQTHRSEAPSHMPGAQEMLKSGNNHHCDWYLFFLIEV